MSFLINIPLLPVVVTMAILLLAWQWELLCADAAFENLKAGSFEDIELVDTELMQ
jgi:hypothetical protein